MGEVWRAEHSELGRDSALKFILPSVGDGKEILARFKREAQVMAKLGKHPNAVAIHDKGTIGGQAFFEMDYIPGRTLAEAIKGRGPMPLEWTSEILFQLCSVLQYAHDLKIVHRDLKPANLMLDPAFGGREVLKVLDFGIAKLVDDDGGEELTKPGGGAGGTAPYMSPEQCMGDDLDHRSDLYSVGLILFELLTGSRPFQAKNYNAWLMAHTSEPAPRFRQVNPCVEVAPEVEKVVLRCLAKSPDQRPASAQALAEEFAIAVNLPRPPGQRFPILTGGLADSRVLPPPSEAAGASNASGMDSLEASTLSGSPGDPIFRRPAPAAETDEKTETERHAPRRRMKFRFVAVGLVACLAAIGAFVKFRPGPTPPPRTFVSWHQRDFWRYGENVHLPRDCEPGDKAAEDGWPKEIVLKGCDGAPITFLRIPPGKYTAGRPTEVWDEARGYKYKDFPNYYFVDGVTPNSEKLREDVPVPGFYIQSTEVSGAQLAAFIRGPGKGIEDGDIWLKAYVESPSPDQPEERPAARLSRDLASAFAASLGGVLPTRTQWEFAASSRGERLDFVWGDLGKDLSQIEKNVRIAYYGEKSAPVGRSKGDVTREGVFDMGGNVREFCRDDPGAPRKWLACGGCFNDGADISKCGVKVAHEYNEPSDELGFRVVIECPTLEDLSPGASQSQDKPAGKGQP
jgi:serine/threonine-protein kinase